MLLFVAGMVYIGRKLIQSTSCYPFVVTVVGMAVIVMAAVVVVVVVVV